MTDSFGNDEALSRRKLDRLIFEIDQQFSFDYIKKFVVISMLVPVILAFDHSQADYRLVHFA